MRIDQVGGLTGRLVEGEWHRSLEVVVENTTGATAVDVVVRADSESWNRAVRFDAVDSGAVLPVLLTVPNDEGMRDLAVTVEYTDDDGRRRSVEAGWKPGPDRFGPPERARSDDRA